MKEQVHVAISPAQANYLHAEAAARGLSKDDLVAFALGLLATCTYETGRGPVVLSEPYADEDQGDLTFVITPLNGDSRRVRKALEITREEPYLVDIRRPLRIIPGGADE